MARDFRGVAGARRSAFGRKKVRRLLQGSIELQEDRSGGLFPQRGRMTARRPQDDHIRLEPILEEAHGGWLVRDGGHLVSGELELVLDVPSELLFGLDEEDASGSQHAVFSWSGHRQWTLAG